MVQVLFKLFVCVLGLRENKTIYNTSPLKGESQFPIALWVSWTSALSVAFLSQMFSGLISPVQIPVAEVLAVGNQLVTPLGDSSSLCITALGMEFLVRMCSAFTTHLNVVFLSFIVEKQFILF